MMNTQENLLMTEGEFFILAYLMAFYFKFPSEEDQLGHNLAFHNLRFLGMAVLKAWILSIGSLYHQFLVNVPNPRTKDKKSVLLLLLC